jgi:alcohol dehydrogenase class IV
VVFGRGAVADAVALVGGPGYTLLTTPRAAGQAPALVDAAATVHRVPAGHVDAVAGDLLGTVSGDRLVALGGGRVVDVTKALAAANGVRAMAVPTTLSGAEMTRGHRHARGLQASTPRVRPSVVVCDPALAASQPELELAASALNALGHAVEAPCTTRANPVSTLAAHEAARLLHRAFARPGGPDREAAALGALLAGYAIDSGGLGLHHVLAQTLVREAGVGHASANAALLPHTIGALAWRRPEAHDALTTALGAEPAVAATRIGARAGATTLSELGLDRQALPAVAQAAARRDELELTPPRAEVPEILALYEQAL